MGDDHRDQVLSAVLTHPKVGGGVVDGRPARFPGQQEGKLGGDVVRHGQLFRGFSRSAASRCRPRNVLVLTVPNGTLSSVAISDCT